MSGLSFFAGEKCYFCRNKGFDLCFVNLDSYEEIKYYADKDR